MIYFSLFIQSCFRLKNSSWFFSHFSHFSSLWKWYILLERKQTCLKKIRALYVILEIRSPDKVNRWQQGTQMIDFIQGYRAFLITRKKVKRNRTGCYQWMSLSANNQWKTIWSSGRLLTSFTESQHGERQED